MAFKPAEWFEPFMPEHGLDLGADGLPRQGSSFWDGVPPVGFDGRGTGCIGGDDGGGGTIVHRRFVNGPNRFVWLATMYDDVSDTAYGYYNLNCGEGNGRWGLIPVQHMRMLGGRVDPLWRPLPYADALRHPARVSAPEGPPIRLPPHSLVGFDAFSEQGSGGAGGSCAAFASEEADGAYERMVEIPRGATPCGTDSETGRPVYEYVYAGVPQHGAAVVVDSMYLSRDDRALRLARRLNESCRYAVRVCRLDGGCPLCRGREIDIPMRRRTPAAQHIGGGRQ